MKIFLENFENLHFTETTLSPPKTEGQELVVSVENLLLLSNHPFRKEGASLINGFLIFKGVLSAKRILTEYIGDPKNPDGFKESYEIDDVSSQIFFDEVIYNTYTFEGLLRTPSAWVDWSVKAKSFELHI